MVAGKKICFTRRDGLKPHLLWDQWPFADAFFRAYFTYPMSVGLSASEGQVDRCRLGQCPGLRDWSRWRCCSATWIMGMLFPLLHLKKNIVFCDFVVALDPERSSYFSDSVSRPFGHSGLSMFIPCDLNIIFPSLYCKSSISGPETFMKSVSHGLRLANFLWKSLFWTSPHQLPISGSNTKICTALDWTIQISYSNCTAMNLV